MAILIVGGAGYIGSYVNLMMNKKGFETIVLDNLSTGNKDAVNVGTLIVGDLGDTATLKKVFEDNDIDAVMHFAAHTAVGESVKDPGKYYHNNVVNTLALLDTMVDYGETFLILVICSDIRFSRKRSHRRRTPRPSYQSLWQNKAYDRKDPR